MNGLLDPVTIMKLVKALKGDTMLNSAVVRLYETDRNGSWSNTGKSGALFVTNEKGSDCNFFKLVDLKSEELIWSHELYLGFRLDVECPYFATFDSDQSVIGLLFAEGQNLKQFQKSLEDIMSSYGRETVPPSNNVSSGRTQSTITVTPPKETSTTNTSKPAQKEEKKGMFGWVKGIFGDKQPKTPKRGSVKISRAEGFTRVTHIGFDPQKGFVYENLPSDWQEMFAANGIDRSTLENPQQAKQLVKAMKKFEKELESRRPPPPVPKRKNSTDSQSSLDLQPVTEEKTSPKGPPPPVPLAKNAPPPPPPMNVPPPPPPPTNFPPPPLSGPFSQPSSTDSSPRSSSITPPISPSMARNSLLSDIRAGKKLKDSKRVSLNLQDMTQEEKNSFASCLQKAMVNIRAGVAGSDEEDDDEDDWSDD